MRPKFGPILSSTARVTQLFGANPGTYSVYGFAGHEGVDLAIGIGSPVASATDGEVLFAGNKGNNYGNYVKIWDPNQNVITLYAHLADLNVKTNAVIEEGQLLGHVGNTGKTTGPHLHFGAMRTVANANRSLIPGDATIQVADALNPDNGYQGWENPFDESLFEWPLIWYPSAGVPGATPSVSGSAGAAEATFSGLTFDQIFAKYYAGWGRLEAEADFFRTYAGDLTKLLVARGMTLDEVKKKVLPRPAALKKTYPLNPQFAGLTLKKINDGGIPLGRVDILAGFLGFSENTPMFSGQLLNLSSFPTEYYPNSSEWLGVQKLTSTKPIGVAGDYYLLPEYDGMTLADIRGKANLPFRSDIMAGFLGISDQMPISKYQGIGIGGFPPSYIPGSGEWEGFNKIFTKTAPPIEQAPGTDVPDVNPPVPEVPITFLGPSITVKSTPARGKFYIDGLYFNDITPSNKPYPVVAGTHTVRVEKSGYKTLEVSVMVAEDEQKVVELTMEAEATVTTPPTTPPTTSRLTLAKLDVRLARVEKALTDKGILV